MGSKKSGAARYQNTIRHRILTRLCLDLFLAILDIRRWKAKLELPGSTTPDDTAQRLREPRTCAFLMGYSSMMVLKRSVGSAIKLASWSMFSRRTGM
jgi:hypothetical protein